MRGARARARAVRASSTRPCRSSAAAIGIRWISVGLLISAVPLLVALVWTMVALAAVAGPPAHPALDARCHRPPVVVGGRVQRRRSHRRCFATANEIHIPVGVPVLVRLHGGRCHSQLLGAEAIGQDRHHSGPDQCQLDPGATNPAAIRGQCTRILRLSACAHALRSGRRARRRLRSVARGSNCQRRAAPRHAGADARAWQLVEYRCGLCHRRARHGCRCAVSAPDLTHLDEPPHDCSGHAAQQSRKSRPAGSRIRRTSSRALSCRISSSRRSNCPMCCAYLETLQ